MKLNQIAGAAGILVCISCHSIDSHSPSISAIDPAASNQRVIFHGPAVTPLRANLEQASAPILTFALKFVEYVSPVTGKPALSQQEALGVTEGVNYIFGQCNLQFKLDQYVEVNAAEKGLGFALSSMDGLDKIREQFDDVHQLVIVNTGAWDHKSMGPANAWTEMPGQNPSGSIIEAPVALDAPIVAHELGHYLGLDHLMDSADLMNPLIYSTSVRVNSGQCDIMRQTALTARSQALRQESSAI